MVFGGFSALLGVRGFQFGLRVVERLVVIGRFANLVGRHRLSKLRFLGHFSFSLRDFSVEI
jgi:hypothetical protein